MTGITIEDINLQIDKSGSYIEGKVEITITLKNNSKTLVRPYRVVNKYVCSQTSGECSKHLSSTGLSVREIKRGVQHAGTSISQSVTRLRLNG